MNYHKKYYVEKYKAQMEAKTYFCEACQTLLRGWNINKHFRTSKKHKYNTSTDEEKAALDKEKVINKLMKKKTNLEQQLSQF